MDRAASECGDLAEWHTLGGLGREIRPSVASGARKSPAGGIAPRFRTRQAGAEALSWISSSVHITDTAAK